MSKERIAALRNNPAYHNSKHPDHGKVVDEISEILLSMEEDVSDENGAGDATMTKLEREEKIATLMRDPAWGNNHLPGHKRIHAEILALRGIDPRIMDSDLTVQQAENALKRQGEMIASGELGADVVLTLDDVEGYTSNQQEACRQEICRQREADSAGKGAAASDAGKEGSHV